MRRVSITVVAWSLAACAGAPVQEMSDARQALRAAQAAGADEYAPAPLAEAERLVGVAQAELEQRDYRSAQQAAVEARKQALQALESARAARQVPEAAPASPQP
jgi:hypothetical protein